MPSAVSAPANTPVVEGSTAALLDGLFWKKDCKKSAEWWMRIKSVFKNKQK